MRLISNLVFQLNAPPFNAKLPGLYHLRYTWNSFDILPFEIEGTRSARIRHWSGKPGVVRSNLGAGRRKCDVGEGRQLNEKAYEKGGCVVEGRL